MGLLMICCIGISVAVGFGFGSILPDAWGFTPAYGLMLASAIYLLGFHPLFVKGRVGGAVEPPHRWGDLALLPRSLLRVTLLLAMNAAFLYLRYGTSEPVDLTWPLATIASWSVVESWVNRKPAGAIVGGTG